MDVPPLATEYHTGRRIANIILIYAKIFITGGKTQMV
jgi:hypothetical protein